MDPIKNYFSHDSNARNSDKLINVRMELGAEGYGIYFMILERLREENEYKSKRDYKMIAFDLRVDIELVRKIVEDFDLFTLEDDCFYSSSFLKRMNIKDAKLKKKQEAGKKGAESRWGKAKNDEENSKNIAMLSENNSTTIAEPSKKYAKEKKRKEKESKEKIIYNTSHSNTDFKKIMDAWNKIDELPKLQKIANGTQRYNLLNARLKEYGLDKVLECVHGVEHSSFLRGLKSNNGWRATFDWVIKPSNFIKILEGNYADREEGANGVNQLGGEDSTPKGDKSKYDYLYANKKS